MRAVILDGSSGDEMVVPRGAAESTLREAGYEVETVRLRDLNIADCLGCFGCWVRTPGQCVVQDDGAKVAGSFATSEVVVMMTPVVFGGYSYHLKKALDRSISFALPFFKRVHGEVHHPRRYSSDQWLVGIGLLPRRDEAAQKVFNELVRRNSLNFQPVGWSAALVFADEAPQLSSIAVKEALVKAGVGP